MPEADLALLMALRVKGVSPAARAAVAAGVPADDVAARLGALESEGLAEELTGRFAGFKLTPKGVDVLDELMGAEALRGDVELTEAYERFLLVNQRVLRACSDWQVRGERGFEEPNDHTDPSYDASVIDRLVELHKAAQACLDRMAKRAPRFATYRSRLDDCVERLLNGDGKAFTAPLVESYHTVWYELHQDLLLTLGLERES